jgi:hypothetical protein
MGTRSLTVVKDSRNKEIIVLYRQYDGYPTGHGNELVEFLKPFTIVNGLSGDRSKVANGMECLAAQLVCHFKTEPGNFYLHPSGSRDLGEEFIYEISEDKKSHKLQLRVFAGDVTFFGLPGTKQAKMPIIWEGNVENFDAKSAESAYEKLSESIPNGFIENATHKRIVEGKQQ